MKTVLLTLVALITLISSNVLAKSKDYEYGGTSRSSSKSGNDYGSGYGTGANSSNERVNGYTKQDGTYVDSYQRTKANNTDSDNYSTKGNYNPYSGKTGSKRSENSGY